MDPTVLNQCLSCDFGGISIVLLFDDCHQLAPVVGFSHFDSMVGKDESCDEVARIFF